MSLISALKKLRPEARFETNLGYIVVSQTLSQNTFFFLV
jgi:hypothetical protein